MPEEKEKELTLVEIMGAISAQKALIEEKFKFDPVGTVKFEEEMRVLDERIKQIERMLSPNTISIPGAEAFKDKFSWGRAFYGVVTNDWDKAPFEKEIFGETRKAALEAGTGSTGGFIVPVQYTTELIEMLEAVEILSQMGVSKLTNLAAGVIEMPKQTGGATAYWVGENQDITESALTFGTMSMSPKSVAALVKTSARLLSLSNPSIDTIIKRDIALRIALKISLAGFRGTGSSTQPRGLVNTPGINVVYAGGEGNDGGNVDFDLLQDMEYALEEDNALFGKLLYAFHPCTRRNLMKLKVKQFSTDTGGQYIIQPVTPSMLTEWIGYPWKTSTQIPTNLTYNAGTSLTEIVLGNWQEFIMAMWGGIQIMASQETSDAFQKNQTWIRIIQDVDMGVRHPESFCVCSDARKVNA
jgi:HK97 family phage major capsid protein